MLYACVCVPDTGQTRTACACARTSSSRLIAAVSCAASRGVVSALCCAGFCAVCGTVACVCTDSAGSCSAFFSAIAPDTNT